MKLSVSTYSFRKAIQAGEMSQFDCIRKAKEIGFDAVEFSGLSHDEWETDAEYAERVRRESEKENMEIAAFMFTANFLKETAAETAAETERVKRMIDIAEIMGIRTVRHDVSVGNGKTSFDHALPVLASACREITEYAAEKGIRTCVENHGYFCQGAERLEKIYNAVNHENFGLLVDMGNFACVDETPSTAVARTAQYAIHVHAKDFYIRKASSPDPGEGFFKSSSGNYLRGAIVGQGDIDVMHCIKALQKAGYDGYLGLEFEGMEDCILGVTVGLNNLRRYLSED